MLRDMSPSQLESGRLATLKKHTDLDTRLFGTEDNRERTAAARNRAKFRLGAMERRVEIGFRNHAGLNRTLEVTPRAFWRRELTVIL